MYIKIVSPKIIIFSENCCIIIDSIFSPMVLLHISMKRCTTIMNGECNTNIILINVAKGNCTAGGSLYFQREDSPLPMLNFSPHKIRKYFHLAYKQKCLRYVFRFLLPPFFPRPSFNVKKPNCKHIHGICFYCDKT